VAKAARRDEIAHKDIFPERVMSNRNLAAAEPQICSAGSLSSRSLARSPARSVVRSFVASIIEFLRVALRRFTSRRRERREREQLYAFLASDHRIAADIGYRHHRE
jgi:hypothetical protein